mmetsp:Transcript_6144/g.16311  ORF Transcript_6144/g.16311 Transcript_6144/m.16311 type:complete len:263 (-) Transcript_6144:386-1174(-)
MAQVQDVAARSCFLQALSHALLDGILRGKKQRGVYVPLHRNVMPQALPHVGHVYSPVDANHIRACGLEPLQQSPAAISIHSKGDMRVRGLHALHDVPQVRPRPLVPFMWGQLPAPGVKDLHALRSRVDLELDIGGCLLCQVTQQGMQHVGCVVAHGLDSFVDATALPLHNVRGQRPWGAYEAKDSCLVSNFASQLTQCISHKSQSVQLQAVQLLDALHVLYGVINDGALVVINIERHAHRRQGSEDVAEQDDAIRPEGAPGL